MPDILPSDPEERKKAPICRGVLDYFPLAIAEIARVSLAATQQHHPDEPMHWDRPKSCDHADCIARHLIDRGKIDADGQRHSAKMAWRSLALLQLELESDTCSRGLIADTRKRIDASAASLSASAIVK